MFCFFLERLFSFNGKHDFTIQWLEVSKMMNNSPKRFLKMKINKNGTKIISPGKFLVICKIHKIIEIKCLNEMFVDK